MSFKNGTHALQSIGSSKFESPVGDMYPTPRIAVEKLLEHEKFQTQVWEPACGEGDIAHVFEQHGHDVYSSDLHNWGFGHTGVDFLKSTPITTHGFDIVTNPPYNISTDFALRALDCTKPCKGKVALLLRLAWLEGGRRYNEIFSQYPLKKTYVFSKRLPRMHAYGYTGKKTSSMIAFAWFVWDWKYKGRPQLGWM